MSDTVIAHLETAAAAVEVNSNENHEEVAAPVTPAKKRGPATPKLDAEGNPVQKTPRKTATPKTKLDADGNPIPKAERKAATPKKPKLDVEGNPVVPTPKKSASKAKAKTVKIEGSQDDGNGSGGDNAIAANDGAGDEVAPPATPASKKRANKAAADAETPSKRIKGNALPTCKAELSEQDKMMMEWKEQGKSWGDINAEYARIIGKPVGKSTLTVRYGRLKASLVELKDGDMERVLIAKDAIDKKRAEELEQFKVDQVAALASFEGSQNHQAWSRMAAMVEDMGGDKYTGDAVQKAYSKERQAGFPHKETEVYLSLLVQDAPTEKKEEGSQAEDDEVEVNFNEEGNPVYAENSEEQTPGTVIHKQELHTDAPVKGVSASRKGSLAEILSESSSGKSTSQEDDGAVFN